VLATLGAPQRPRWLAQAKRKSQPEPDPFPVTTGRATIIDVGTSFEAVEEARAWLARVDEDAVVSGVAILNRVIHAFRLVTADPYLRPVQRRQALVARVGYGAGEQVADGLWTDARELFEKPGRRRRRAKLLEPQARLAAVLGGREPALVCEELALRARLDLDHDRHREAALQLLVALDAALAELAVDGGAASALETRLSELRDRRAGVAAAAQAALAGPLTGEQREVVAVTLGRIESALRARAVELA
jgi:hypothetical protein